MAFSFNWAGLSVPQVNVTQPAITSEDFRAMGTAARGYKNRQAASEFADKIDNYRRGIFADKQANQKRIAEIEAEIARLEQENAQLSAVSQQPNPGQNIQGITTDPSVRNAENGWVTPDEYDAILFDPNKANEEQIKLMQQALGVTADGDWGGESQSAYDKKYGYLFL